MASIHFFNEDLNYRIRNKKLLRQWILNTIMEEKKTIEGINFILTSDVNLHKINLEYLSHDTFTDIITFQYNAPEEAILSDIFISFDQVKENAKLFCVRQLDELHRITIHGVLHLLGYKDKNKADKQLMTSKEDYYLSLRPEELVKY
jgi:rRNA maturation RNase YbeY